MSDLTSNISSMIQEGVRALPIPKLGTKVEGEKNKKSRFDLTDPVTILVIWDILFGIPFALLVALVHKLVVTWFGVAWSGVDMGSFAGVFLSRTIVVLVNLVLLASWKKALDEEQCTNVIRAETRMLDEVIASLEKVLAGVEAKEVDEQIDHEIASPLADQGKMVDKKTWQVWNQGN